MNWLKSLIARILAASPGADERRHKIEGAVFVQRELTWAKDEMLGEILEAAFSGIDEKVATTRSVILHLLREKSMPKFLSIILEPDLSTPARRAVYQKLLHRCGGNAEDVYRKITNSELVEVLESFFFINRKSLDNLPIFASAIQLLSQGIALGLGPTQKPPTT